MSTRIAAAASTILLLVFAGEFDHVSAQDVQEISAPSAPAPADVESPASIVRATYESVTRAPGEHFDWERFRTLFLPTARLIPSRGQTGGQFTPLSVNGFVEWIDSGTVVGGPNDRGFAEEEISHVAHRYGVIAQVFSTYQKHFWNDENILGRGINAFQLVYQDGRWWIESITWEEEVDAGPIPETYRGG